MNNKYIESKQKRKRNFLHWQLAINQMIQYPFLFILIIPIIILTIIIWSNMDFLITIFNVPKIIFPIYASVVKLLGVLTPILLVWGLIDVIGILIAKKDEETIRMVFSENELRNGSPILMYKRKNKNTGITVREWYSHIPMKLWIEHQDEIADAMSIHFVENFRYGGNSNGNRIVMCSANGRNPLMKENLVYDKDLEQDMEMLD